jgi:hypothetical protein
MCGRRFGALALPDFSYRCIRHPLFQQAHDDTRDVAQDVVMVAVIAELLHDPGETRLRKAQPLDVGAQITSFLHPCSPAD